MKGNVFVGMHPGPGTAMDTEDANKFLEENIIGKDRVLQMCTTMTFETTRSGEVFYVFTITLLVK